MKAIIRRCIVFAAFSGFAILTGVVILIFGGTTSRLQSHILPAIILIGGAVSTGFWVEECKKLKIARLIVENTIIQIRTAVIREVCAEAKQPSDIEASDVFISYFGILLNTRVIKFNQGGIRLKAVEIGDDFICFTYGTERWIQSTWLLRPAIDPVTIHEISEKFRYETGIVPTFVA